MEQKYGEIGCFVRMKGIRTKHKVVGIEHIGNHFPDLVIVIELCTGEKTNTTWRELSEWQSKYRKKNLVD
jgi:hypothetical protein